MKKIKPLKKNLSLSKETVRSLTGNQLDRVAGGAVVTSDGDTGQEHNSCNTACAQHSCAIC